MSRWTEDDYKALMKKRTVPAGGNQHRKPYGSQVAQPTGRAVLGKPDVQPKESELERRFLQQLEQANLTECCIREYYAIDGRDFRLDFAFPSRKIGVEVQGMAHRVKKQFRADIEKRALHLLAGWRVLEIGGAEIRSGVAIEWLKQLLA